MPESKKRAVTLVALVALAAGCGGGGGDPVLLDPGATSTLVPSSTQAPATSAQPETIEDFLAGMVGSYRTGNPVFLVQRVHPELRDYYGREACRKTFEGLAQDDTAAVSVRTIDGPGAWSETFDGRTFSFLDVYTVDVEFVDFGSVRRQDMQIAQIGDRFYFFQDCGEPPVATTTTTLLDVSTFDVDGDGFFYVHSGAGDSEDFRVPARFRITYTGTDTTCSFQLLDSATGSEAVYVTGLQGGGMKRVILSQPDSTVYISDVLGCRGGEVQVGPNP